MFTMFAIYMWRVNMLAFAAQHKNTAEAGGNVVNIWSAQPV